MPGMEPSVVTPSQLVPEPSISVSMNLVPVGLTPLVAANKTLLDLTGPDTKFVPGVGPVQSRAALQAQHDMLTTMRDRMHKMFRQGMGLDDMMAAGVSKDYDAAWGSPDVPAV